MKRLFSKRIKFIQRDLNAQNVWQYQGLNKTKDVSLSFEKFKQEQLKALKGCTAAQANLKLARMLVSREK